MDAPRPLPSDDPRIYVSTRQLNGLATLARKLTLLPRFNPNSALNGRHASRLRGCGLNFEELRNYLPGDDIRALDWKVTARTGTPYVRVYSEERERPVWIIVDQRIAMFFGTMEYMKSVVAAEAAAILAHCVIQQGDRPGGLVFNDQNLSEHRPLRRQKALFQFLSAISAANGRLSANMPDDSPDMLNAVLKSVQRMAQSGGTVIILSDFDGLDTASEHILGQLVRKNDLILCNVSDPAAKEIPAGAAIAVSDGRLQAELDFRSAAIRRKVQNATENRQSKLQSWCDRHGTSLLQLNTKQPAADQLLAAFGQTMRVV